MCQFARQKHSISTIVQVRGVGCALVCETAVTMKSAGLTELEQWSDDVLDAKTLEEVFQN